MARKLYRSETNTMIAGVCGGLGEHVGIDPVIVRVAWVIFSFAFGWGFPAYVMAWILVPTESRIDLSPRQVAREGVRDVLVTTWQFTKEAIATLRRNEQKQSNRTEEGQAVLNEDAREHQS